MDYRKKYLKYKEKYISLKNLTQDGGLFTDKKKKKIIDQLNIYLGKTNKEIEILQYIKDNLKNIKDNLKNIKDNLQKNDEMDKKDISDYIIFYKMFLKFYSDKRNKRIEIAESSRYLFSMYEMEWEDVLYLNSLKDKDIDKDIKEKCNEIDKKTADTTKLLIDIIDIMKYIHN
jgi:hypothetical protein